MTLDDAEAQFHRAVTEAREGRTEMAVRRMHLAFEEYAATRAGQILDEIIRTASRRMRERRAAS